MKRRGFLGWMAGLVGAGAAAAVVPVKAAGIDEREGVRLLYEALGVEDCEAILDRQYPRDERRAHLAEVVQRQVVATLWRAGLKV